MTVIKKEEKTKKKIMSGICVAPTLLGRGNAVAHIYSILRDEILSLRLMPGTYLDESSLVNRFGLSRTPIRQALERLAGDGLVLLTPNRRVQVSHLNLSDLPQFVETLDLLQRASFRLAALRRTNADLKQIEKTHEIFEKASIHENPVVLIQLNRNFHAAIVQASNNRYLSDGYMRLLDEGMRMLIVPFGYDSENGGSAKEHAGRVDSEHLEIVKAIRDKNPDQAEDLGRSHAELFRSRLLEYLGQNILTRVSISEN